MLSPLFAGEVDLSFLQAIAKRAPVAMDIQGFLRVPVENDLVFKPWDQMNEGLKSITYLKVDRAEAEYITGLTDLKSAAKKLSEMGPKEIVLTQSSGSDCLCWWRIFRSTIYTAKFNGRTGRGDTCFSTYLAKRITDNAETACQWAGIITSLKQEKSGPWKGTKEDIIGLLNK